MDEQIKAQLNPTPSSAQIKQPAAASIIQTKYAGFWVRLAAYIIDIVIILIALLVLQFLFAALMPTAGTSALTAKYSVDLIAAAISTLYFIILTNKYQATVGKMVMRIKVVSETEKKASLAQIVWRELVGKFISYTILYIGYIMAAFTKKKQALHDKIAKTVVVYK